MPDTATLSTAPFEHPALDYDFLRREGIRYLESLAGHLWTDFNTHDPGITILEQLCYAITDLAYRTIHDIPDLLATSSGDPYRSLYSASSILTSHPVTRLDLRKLIIDIDGVNNAWIEEVAERRPALHVRGDKRELGFQADPPYTTPVLIKGLVRVLIERSDRVDRPDGEIYRDVAHRLFACRPLCTDIDEIRVLASQPIQVDAKVEIGPVDDAEGVLAAIYQALSEQISPPVRFQSLGEMLAAGKRSDEIFEGPVLDHGFLASETLEALRRKDAIHTSDLIREIMSVPGVRAVRSIAVSANNAGWEPWSLALDPSRTPRLDLLGSSISLMKGPLKARLDTARIVDALVERHKQAASRTDLSPGDRDFLLPAGHDRNIAQYRSIQHHFPTIYGVGAAGLPDSATDLRKAQAKQLKAYLLFFDQLLASYFAQLANAGSLFSFFDDDTRTYFTQIVDDEGLGLSDVRMFDAATHRSHLQAIAEDRGAPGSLSTRKHRFLNHLMARFAEQFTDYSLVLFGASDRLVPDKQAFLQHYPRISSARGTGLDVLAQTSAGGVSGLAERIERKLGLSAEHGERLILVEHVLLAPMNEDNLPPGQLEFHQLPVLSDSVSRDPYSLQLSVVLAGWRGRLKQDDKRNELRLLVAHTVREETPAHLTPFIHWLDETQWPLFETAYDEWRGAYHDYRAAKLGLDDRAAKLGPIPMDDPRYLRVRDARDRLIDLLGFGTTYPLRDLPVRGDTVPFNQPAKISIDASQRGVTYELRSDRDRALATAEGTGGTISLQTPPMQEDTTFHILARKLAPVREAYLQQPATVKVGLDVTLHARIVEADLLDPSIERPVDEDARIVGRGTRVRVQIDHSQEGVDYHLVQIAGGQEQMLSEDVRGNLGDIVLSAAPVGEDLELRIRATKVFDPSEHRPTQTELLAVVLPLKVRARLDLPVSLEPGSLVDFDAGATVRIDNTQANAVYSLYVGAISDRDFAFDAATPGLVSADVDGEPRVYVVRPPQHPVWQDLEGFQQLGAPVQGNGGTLRLPLSAFRQDSVIVVRARKDHRQGAATLPSSVQLTQAALLLVRPDPQPLLEVGVVMEGARTDGTLELTGGQAGVFYQVRRDPDGPLLGLPAYFHKTDERDLTSNKGIARASDPRYGLRILGDFALSRGTQRTATTSIELATTPPLSPLLATEPLDAGTTLSFRAVKAQTRAAARLARTARIAPVPQILADPAVIPQGSATKIVVRASAAGDRYQLSQGGKPIGQARDGDGSDLVFTLPPVSQSTRFQMLVTRPVELGIPVQRTVSILVTVAPSA
jgi:hypothetical protein